VGTSKMCQNRYRFNQLFRSNCCYYSEEIRLILRNPKAHNRVQNSPESVPILKKMNPVDTFQACFLIHFSVILVSMLRFSYWPLSFKVPYSKFVWTSAVSPARYIILYLTIVTITDKEHKIVSSSLCSVLQRTETNVM
jgi:hypothetical protein